MKLRSLLLAATVATLATPALAQVEQPLVIAPTEQAEALSVLPANTEVTLRMNKTLTTTGNELQEGDTFSLTVASDVYLEDRVIIPKGSRAGGRVSWLTSKGAFGKSGKMEIDIEYVEVGGRRVPLEGHYRQEGEGNTVATIGGVLVAGVFAGFVAGKSGVIPQGRELVARTKEDLPLRFAARRLPVYAEAAAPSRPEVQVRAPVREQAAQPTYGLVTVTAH